MSSQLGQRRRGGNIRRHHARDADLPDHRYGTPNHGGLFHAYVTGKRPLHLTGMHVVPAADVHVAAASGEGEVAVGAEHAVPSEFPEDDVKVTAVLREGAMVTEEELCRWSLDKLPYFAVPRHVEFRTELPRNQTGKTLKHQLRDEGHAS